MEPHDHADHDHDHGHTHGVGHAHGPATQGLDARMATAVALNLIFVVIESGFGFVSDSVALIADAGHNLSDVLGLLCAWTAMYFGRRPQRARVQQLVDRSPEAAAHETAPLLQD